MRQDRQDIEPENTTKATAVKMKVFSIAEVRRFVRILVRQGATSYVANILGMVPRHYLSLMHSNTRTQFDCFQNKMEGML